MRGSLECSYLIPAFRYTQGAGCRIAPKAKSFKGQEGRITMNTIKLLAGVAVIVAVFWPLGVAALGSRARALRFRAKMAIKRRRR